MKEGSKNITWGGNMNERLVKKKKKRELNTILVMIPQNFMFDSSGRNVCYKHTLEISKSIVFNKTTLIY